jgi:hypothetical protein
MVDVTTETVEAEAPEATATDLIAAAVPYITDAIGQIFTALGQIASLVQDLLDSRIVCFQCYGDHTAAQRAGLAAEQLPPVNIANLIVDGKGVCHNHVRVGGGILLPGQA